MRIKFGRKICEVDRVHHSLDNDERFVIVFTSNGKYYIDCESKNGAVWLMYTMLTKGYFNATGIDYNNVENDKSWFEYCLSKNEEQKVFNKWIQGEYARR